MTTLAELVAAPPIAAHGVPAGFVYGSGEWRHVLEVADPAEGSAVQWYDITPYFTGYDYTRGADSYAGRFSASVATLDLYADDDRLAPWNDNTTIVFGVDLELGPGLLIRSAFIRVDGGAVVEWNARFTNKVESWSDASFSKGRVRQHRIVARDTLSSLVGVPLPARPEENWTQHLIHLIGDSGWPYGQIVFGAQFTSGGAPIKLLPARPVVSDAAAELDVILEPVGLIWYVNQRGQLMIRPAVNDTFHKAAFAAGASGGEWIDPAPVVFRWDSCMGGGGAAYAVDTSSVNPFGLDKSESAVINHVVVSTPENGTITEHLYDSDDPVSIQRYDRKTFSASWIAANDQVATDLLAFRANATVEARPLTTTVELPGFHPGPAHLEYAEPITIIHRNRIDGSEVTATGFLRGYHERVLPRGCDTEWSMEITVDVEHTSSIDTALLPVEDLTMIDRTDTTAGFTWSNPTQVTEPTHTQIRMRDATSAWETIEYPAEQPVSWSFLRPSTGYQFEVRLVRIVDGVFTHFSPIRNIVFFTLDPETPWLDDDTFHFPPTTCPIQWKLEHSVDGLTSWTVVDSGTATSGSLVYDLASLNPAFWYRMQSREVCPGVDPGPWLIGDPFVVSCADPSRLAESPFNDPGLYAYWPQVCGARVIEEARSDVPLTLGSAYAGTGPDFSGNTVMKSAAKGVIGNSDLPVSPPGSNKLTISCQAMIGTLPTGEQWLFQFGGLVIAIYPSGSGYAVRGYVRHAGGSSTAINGTTVLTTSTVHTFTLDHQVGISLTLSIDGEVEEVAPAVPARISSSASIQLPASSWITDCAAFVPVVGLLDPATAIFYYDSTTRSGTVLPNTGTTPGLGMDIFKRPSSGPLEEEGAEVFLYDTTGATLPSWDELGGLPLTAPFTVALMTGSQISATGVFDDNTSAFMTLFDFDGYKFEIMRANSDFVLQQLFGDSSNEVTIAYESGPLLPNSLYVVSFDLATNTPVGWRRTSDMSEPAPLPLLSHDGSPPTAFGPAMSEWDISMGQNVTSTGGELEWTGIRRMGVWRITPTADDVEALYQQLAAPSISTGPWFDYGPGGYDVCYLSGTTWVLVNSDGFARSVDNGLTWVAVPSVTGLGDALRQLAHNGDLVLASGTHIRRSTDRGVTWSGVITSPFTVANSGRIRNVCSMVFANGIFILAGDDGADSGLCSGWITTTTDGLSFTTPVQVLTGTGGLLGAGSQGGDVFQLCHVSGSTWRIWNCRWGPIFTAVSTNNGATWGAQVATDLDDLSVDFGGALGSRSVLWDGSQFIMTGSLNGYNNNRVLTSSDGVTWSYHIVTGLGSGAGVVARDPGSGLVITGQALLASSDDGATWTVEGYGMTSYGLHNVTFGNGQFIMAGYRLLIRQADA